MVFQERCPRCVSPSKVITTHRGRVTRQCMDAACKFIWIHPFHPDPPLMAGKMGPMTEDYSDGIFEEDGLIIERKGKWARVVGKTISDGELYNRILDREFKKLRDA